MVWTAISESSDRKQRPPARHRTSSEMLCYLATTMFSEALLSQSFLLPVMSSKAHMGKGDCINRLLDQHRAFCEIKDRATKIAMQRQTVNLKYGKLIQAYNAISVTVCDWHVKAVQALNDIFFILNSCEVVISKSFWAAGGQDTGWTWTIATIMKRIAHLCL